MEEIIVTNQAEMDVIPANFDGIIIIKCGEVVVRNKYKHYVRVCGSSHVRAYGSSEIIAVDSAQVIAYDSTIVSAFNSSHITALNHTRVSAYDSAHVEACDFARITAYNDVQVRAQDRAYVWGCSSVHILAKDYTNVSVCDHVQLKAYNDVRVKAYGHAQVRAYNFVQVTAYDSSIIKAYDLNLVKAHESTQIEACGHSQILNLKPDDSDIVIKGNARIVHLPRNIEEYVGYFGLEINEGKIILYKAVKKEENGYCSFFDSNFKYYIGKTVTEYCDTDIHEICSSGIHIAPLNWVVGYYEDKKDDYAILEVEVDLNKIVVPYNTDGKVRASEVKVIREVPPEEWIF